MQILDRKYFNEIKNYVQKNFNEKEIYFFRNIHSGLIKKFYKNSFLYIFSSHCEVFGLTSLEAMSNKIPVLISNSSSLPEINGKAALYFNPNKSKDIVNKMNKIINNNHVRKSLIIKGKRHIAKFRWSLTYSNLLRIIKI